jgi:ADP-ribose pyrophosphatase YjhB (NUDIX family)
MWQFPNGTLLPGETPSEGVQRILRELLGIEAVVGAAAASIKHTVTRYRVTLTAHLCAVKAVRGARCAVLGEDSAGRQAGAFTEHRAGGRPRGRRTDIDPSTAHGSAAALGCSQIAWVPLAALDEFGLPSAHRRVAEALIREEPQLELAFTG